MNIKISKEHEKALRAINDDYYNHRHIDWVVEELIEDYLLRENGRLGRIDQNGKYIDNEKENL